MFPLSPRLSAGALCIVSLGLIGSPSAAKNQLLPAARFNPIGAGSPGCPACPPPPPAALIFPYGLYAPAAAGAGLYTITGISGNGAAGGVEGVGTNGAGVTASSTSGYGVYSTSASGTAGYFNSASGSYGVIGQAPAAGGVGVYGNGSTIGIYGAGVVGSGSTGVYGSGSNIGVYAAGVNFSLLGQAQNGGSYPLMLYNYSGNNPIFYVDNGGNVAMHGTLSTFVRTRDAGTGRMFVPKSTMQTMEDFGTAALINGSGTVNLDPSFVKMTDGAVYQVFLTPDGDSHGLYVAQKTPSAFTVRESQGGRSSLAFDYRIVAKQYGHSAERASLAASTLSFGEPQARLPAFQPLVKPRR